MSNPWAPFHGWTPDEINMHDDSTVKLHSRDDFIRWSREFGWKTRLKWWGWWH